MKFSLVILLFALFGLVFSNCNSKPGTSKQISTIDSSRIKQLTLNYEEGKVIFKKYCATCHIAPEKQVTDQYIFDNLFERLPSPPEEYFIKYIQDSKTLKLSGDGYALQIDSISNSKYEHSFKDSLTLNNFGDLIIYIKIAARSKQSKP